MTHVSGVWLHLHSLWWVLLPSPGYLVASQFYQRLVSDQTAVETAAHAVRQHPIDVATTIARLQQHIDSQKQDMTLASGLVIWALAQVSVVE